MNDEVQKLSPLYSITQALGGRFADLNGWQVVETYGPPDEEAAAARQGVAVADASARGKWLVEGQAAAVHLQAAWQLPELPIGRGAIVQPDSQTEPLAVYRLRLDRFFVSLPAGEPATALEALAAATPSGDDLLTVTDVSHGRAELWLVGPSSVELLSRLCGLDFDDSRFPDGAAAQSSVAKTAQLIIRRDLAGLPCYALIGDRSLGAYLWQTTLEAGADLGIRPIGRAALARLPAQG